MASSSKAPPNAWWRHTRQRGPPRASELARWRRRRMQCWRRAAARASRRRATPRGGATNSRHSLAGEPHCEAGADVVPLDSLTTTRAPDGLAREHHLLGREDVGGARRQPPGWGLGGPLNRWPTTRAGRDDEISAPLSRTSSASASPVRPPRLDAAIWRRRHATKRAHASRPGRCGIHARHAEVLRCLDETDTPEAALGEDDRTLEPRGPAPITSTSLSAFAADSTARGASHGGTPRPQSRSACSRGGRPVRASGCTRCSRCTPRLS